jgi:periplasmic protein TonB
MNKYAGSVSMDDIVFEGRNKSYGAYELRKINPKYAALATAIAITVFVVGILLSQVEVKFLKKDKDETDISVKSTIVELPEDLPPPIEAPPPPPPPPPPEAPQIKFVEMVVKKDEEVADKEVATQKELQDDKKQVGFENKEGDASAKPKVVDPEQKTFGTGPIASKPKEDKVDDNQVFEIVEKEAEFPGGVGAMMSYISKNLKYPDIALENTIEGTVVVEFVVEKDGSISNVVVLKDIGGGCGAEAARVFKNMPKWNPAKQRDMAVRQRIKAPVKFKTTNR